MDRSSRFQNPVPLSSGGFSKPPPMQNDGVGVKPLPPLLHDRFRAMVKDREEELRVFGGVVGTDEIVRIYEIVLSELTINSKPIITDLTIIAGEQRAHGAGIADAIWSRILEVPVDQKLPSLYLLDSIVKNIGKEYIKFFSARLPEVFCEAYAQVNPNMHSAMRHLFGTWSTVFPLSVLKKIETHLQFSPPVNVQSSGLSSSRASESPRPTHGIHINPKYLEAQRQFGHSTVDPFGTEGVSSTGRADLTTSGDAVRKSLPSASRITRSSPPPYGLRPARSLSPSGPSLEEFGMDSSTKRVVVRQSPSRHGIDYGSSKVMGREEDTSEWRKRNWQGNPKQPLKTSAAYQYSGGIDLRGPRALISAYGMDEREKHLNHKHRKAEVLDSNGAEQRIAVKTWQNTEEEEFDWEDMTPSLADRKQSNDTYSSLRSLGNLTGRQSIITNHAARLSAHGSINSVAGDLPDVAVPSDLTSHIPPSIVRESLILQPQPQSQYNAKGGGSLAEGKNLFTSGEPKPGVIGNFSNIDGKVSGTAAAVSTFNSTYDPPAPEIRLGDAAALTKAWNPTNFQNSQLFPSHYTLPPQVQIRGQFGMNNASNNVHSDPGSSRNMSQVNLPPVSSIRPGMVPVNLHSAAQPSLVHPNFSIPQEARQNLPIPYTPITSNTMAPPLNYGYLAQGQGPAAATPHNLVPGVQPSLPILNAPNMSFPGTTLQHPPRVPLPGMTQALPTGQNIGQVARNVPGGAAFSGLIGSLMAQGLISLKNQDSVGVEFDQDSLKVRRESVVKSLYGDLPRQCKTCGLRFEGQEEHSKHMDWHVNKNRTLKNRKTKPSPKWFVSVNMWLSGAEALGTEAVPGFLPVEKSVEKEEDEELAVPADDSQQACALCGEPFDDFYSDDTEEWMYRGAVYMYAPAVSTIGMDRSQLGPIVHAKCRSDSHGISPENSNKDSMESTEEGSKRKKLRS